MDAAKEIPDAKRNTSRGKIEAGSSVGPPTLRMVEFAHQMRDLLTVVMGSLEQLRGQPLDEQGRRQLARAEVAVERVADLLNRYSPLSDPGQQGEHNAEEPQ
jgi:phospho-acceptor domain-containing protein